MPTTSRGAPYPGPGDPPDISAIVYALAQWTSDQLDQVAEDLFESVPADLLSLGTWVSEQIAAVNTSLADAVPIGTVIEWDAPATAPLPAKYLEQNGQAVSRTTYAGLFALYGTYYGPGNGSTTFNLPNRKGRVAVGRDTGQTEFDTIGETGGAKTVTLTAAQSGNPLTNVVRQQNGAEFYFNVGSDTDPTHRATITGPADAAEAHNNLPPYFVTRFLVKAL